MKGIGHMVTTRARAARLGMAALVVAMAIGATGCIQNGAGSITDSPDDGGGGSTTVSSNLREMPEPGVALPASLSAGGTGTSASSIGASAVGEVVDVERSGLSDVRAQGWYDVVEASEPSGLLTAFVTEIRELASERELEFDTIYSLSEREFYNGRYDMGTMMITGTSADEFTVWWHPEPFDTWDTHIQLNVKRTGTEWETEMLTTIVESEGEATSSDGVPGTAREYAYFNSATGESVQAYAFDPVDQTPPSGHDHPVGYWREISRSHSSGGTVTFVSRDEQTYKYDGSTFSDSGARVGWGNDTTGGVIATGTDDRGGYAAKEYYDENGGLIQRSRGETTLDTDWLSWLDGGHNVADSLGSAPDTIYAFEYWNVDEYKVFISEDADFSDSDNHDVTDDSWNFFYRQGTDWQAGDAVYDWDGSEDHTVDLNGDGETEGRLVTFSKGYEVPASEAVFDGNYYFRNEFPLKSLLPIQGAFADEPLRRHQGETYEEDWGSWTDYTYFFDLDNDNKLDHGGTDHILSNVFMNESWTWAPDAVEATIVKAPFFSTTGTNLPSYFSVPDQSLVTTVESRIDDAYETRIAALDLTDLPVEDISGRPQFDELKN
ncbi:MAG: hypothetical protein ACLFP6_13005 [Spirochaetaceae bacterium]